MTYIDGFVTPVPRANRAAYEAHVAQAAAIFADLGATRLVECRGDDVPAGTHTDFARSVALADDDGMKAVAHERLHREARGPQARAGRRGDEAEHPVVEEPQQALGRVEFAKLASLFAGALHLHITVDALHPP